VLQIEICVYVQSQAWAAVATMHPIRLRRNQNLSFRDYFVRPNLEGWD
jgi:hypothetical protein